VGLQPVATFNAKAEYNYVVHLSFYSNRKLKQPVTFFGGTLQRWSRSFVIICHECRQDVGRIPWTFGVCVSWLLVRWHIFQQDHLFL